MRTWKEMFEIKLRSEPDGDWGYVDYYELINKHSGEVVGTYDDEKYAEKQARYKYKKILSKLEKALLS